MEEPGSTPPVEETPREYKKYAWIRIVIGIVIILVMLWVAGFVLGLFDRSSSGPAAPGKTGPSEPAKHAAAAKPAAPAPKTAKTTSGTPHGESAHGDTAAHAPAAGAHDTAAPPHAAATGDHGTAAHEAPSEDHGTVETHSAKTDHETAPAKAEAPHAAPPPGPSAAIDQPTPVHGHLPAPIGPPGTTFLQACIDPLDYELEDRFWGWRPNDIISLGDNVENFQLGVLEVTRRTAVNLAERLSRTGSAAAFDPNLERAMNWFVVKADRYWFPSPESKFKDGIQELEAYQRKLKRGTAVFYTRPDNLIPLLASFEDLLGSCDENLVKHVEDDGSTVSTFMADDYFYYAKGVATAMHSILTAVMVDFEETLENRDGTELLHHAIETLHRAMTIDPWVVTEGDLSGILANHRANMAAPISHARFYLAALIKTLST